MSRTQRALRDLSCIGGIAAFLVLTASFLAAQDASQTVTELQRRYASVRTLAGSFQQTYRAPGIQQVEAGVFYLQKPGLMRWQYGVPEEKLFVADGRESFLYVPQDRQVTVQALTASDLRNTPFEFLTGSGDITGSFNVGPERELRPSLEGTIMIRLIPKTSRTDYSFISLEVDRETHEIRRISIREQTGNTSEFTFTNLSYNRKLDRKLFQFSIPQGVEVVRLEE